MAVADIRKKYTPRWRMYELIQVSPHCYYIQSPAKIGLVLTGEGEVCLIDSGNDKDAGKKVKRILDAQGWTLKAIYNTHSHADHIGGNKYLQSQTGCAVYAPGIEQDFTRHPLLEPAFLYGGNPPKSLRHKFLMAHESDAQPLTGAVLPVGWELIPLPGHGFDMVGFRTADNVVYLADCFASRETLEKYQISFLTDVAAYLDTLDKVAAMEAACFIPSHTEVLSSAAELAGLNREKVLEIGDTILQLCREPLGFDALLKKVFEAFGMVMTFEQHALVGSTVRSYLTWLTETGRIAPEIRDHVLLWKSL